MSGTQTLSVICPSCDEHFLIDVVDITARAALVAAQKRIAELEASLRDIIAEDPNPKSGYGVAVNETARAALAGVEPAKE